MCEIDIIIFAYSTDEAKRPSTNHLRNVENLLNAWASRSVFVACQSDEIITERLSIFR